MTTLFGREWPDAPHRALRTAFGDQWLDRDGSEGARASDQPLIGATRIAAQEISLTRFTSFPPCAEASGDIDAMCLAAGQSAGLVADVRPATDIVRELVDGAAKLIQGRLVEIVGG